MTNGNDEAMPTDIWCESMNGGFYQEGANPGLTKRELFAAMAMSGLTANTEANMAMLDIAKERGVTSVTVLAQASVDAADALIETLNAEVK